MMMKKTCSKSWKKEINKKELYKKSIEEITLTQLPLKQKKKSKKKKHKNNKNYLNHYKKMKESEKIFNKWPNSINKNNKRKKD